MCDFRDEIFPRERITFKRATVYGIRPVVGVGVRRAVSRGKAAIRLAFLTVSDGCWLYIYFLFAAAPLLSTRVLDCNIQCVHCVARALRRRGISIPPEWLRRLLFTVHIRIPVSYCLKNLQLPRSYAMIKQFRAYISQIFKYIKRMGIFFLWLKMKTK